MAYRDKNNILGNLNKREVVIIELGCGQRKTIPTAIGIDLLDMPDVDIISDLNEGLPFFENESVDIIYSSHFLEHLNNFPLLMNEAYRVLKPGGKMLGIVPHFSNPFFYSDYTHRQNFGLYTFSYFSKSKYFRRDVPIFYNDTDFKIRKIQLIFHSEIRPIHLLRKFFQILINLHPCLLEFYEENLCYFIPAFEIRFELQKVVS